MRVQDYFDVVILDDNHNGMGFVIISGVPVFVRNALKDEFVKVRIVKIFKKYALGEVAEFYKISPLRKSDVCSFYLTCGGCNLFHVSYDRELELKSTYLKRLFGDVFTDITYFSRFGYRNKVTLHVDNGKFGFYDEKSNCVTSFDSCFLLDDEINKFISFIKDFDFSFVREMVIRKGDNGILFSFYGKFNSSDMKRLFSYSFLVSVYRDDELIYGKPYINISFGSVKYFIDHKAFFQVNNECARALYEKVKEYCKGSERVLDLYCGMASIGLYLGNDFSVLGAEINPFSVNCAKVNIKENNSNYEVVLGDASSVVGDFDVTVVDPPRSGLSREVISNIDKMGASKVIYISCNPSTLKRDIGLFSNYYVEEISGFNMFPLTKHVECVCVMKRR
ncbi:MAG: methyltransferase [bacterium]|nr:methyltransferase [bacterium]